MASSIRRGRRVLHGHAPTIMRVSACRHGHKGGDETRLFLLQHLVFHERFHGIYSPRVGLLNEPHLSHNAISTSSLGCDVYY